MKPTLPATLLLAFSPVLAAAADPFAENVRPTEPLPAREQLTRFHVPEGFEIQLFASEPDIAKPMNMAFDEKGRMWLTSSLEYPFPVEPGEPARDTVKILSDTDGDGTADDIHTFADNLDIPIGVLPHRGGAIAWSIPNIWHLEDTDGDGTCDKRTPLYGPLGWRKDTHGMNNSFRRGFDGWMYLTHGFNNETTVRASDGSTLEMQSGHTYRVRMDGSHVDGHTFGQVNPFGLAFDSWGNLYSADCHSKPIYQLIRKGYYPSFGKPHDGMGFAPEMIEHSHNSTGIGGVAICEDERWPEEFRMNAFLGNVVTSRVNRDRIDFHGSSPKAIEMPDLVTCDDPWFRPVDLQMGPDGALYIADFYNRIIGHYEVPLDHPGRDRERGRIWRVVPKGSTTTLRDCDLSTKDLAGLIAATASSNLTLRMIAMNQIVDRIGKSAIPALKESLASSAPPQAVHALWALFQLDALDEPLVHDALGHSDAPLRAHALRALSEMGTLSGSLNAARVAALADPSPFVQRAAADSLSWNRFPASAPALVALIASTPAEDTHLRHTARIALRENLSVEGFAVLAGRRELPADQSRIVAEIASHLKSPAAAAFLLSHIESHENDPAQLRAQLSTIAPNLPDDALARAAELIQTKFPDNPEARINLLLALMNGRPTGNAALKSVGRQLVLDWLASPTESPWQTAPVPGKPESASPWFSQTRASDDGNTDARFLCSLPEGGERLTGILRSRAFAVPERLSFFLAGHDGFPGNAPGGHNHLRLVDAATGEILASAAPPRDDTARRVEWDLSAHTGKSARLEIVDGDTGEAYAWLAAGRFEPDLAPIPAPGPLSGGAGLEAVARLARELDVREAAPLLLKTLADPASSPSGKSEAARTLAAFRDSPVLEALAFLLARPDLGADATAKIVAQFTPDAAVSADFVFAEAATPVQQALAGQLASTPRGAEALVAAMESGKASPHLLRHSPVSTKLDASPDAALKERAATVAANLPPVGEGVDQLIAERLRAYATAPAPDLAAGKAVFDAQCALCHQIGGEGKIVGPQLDGIGNRGPARLLEDILDPNRHVDPAFFVNVLTLTDGRVLSGLVREAAGSVVLVDVAGAESTLRPADIAKRQEARLSLMPPTYGLTLTPEQSTQLIAYLASLSTPASTPAP